MFLYYGLCEEKADAVSLYVVYVTCWYTVELVKDISLFLYSNADAFVID